MQKLLVCVVLACVLQVNSLAPPPQQSLQLEEIANVAAFQRAVLQSDAVYGLMVAAGMTINTTSGSPLNCVNRFAQPPSFEHTAAGLVHVLWAIELACPEVNQKAVVSGWVDLDKVDSKVQVKGLGVSGIAPDQGSVAQELLDGMNWFLDHAVSLEATSKRVQQLLETVKVETVMDAQQLLSQSEKDTEVTTAVQLDKTGENSILAKFQGLGGKILSSLSGKPNARCFARHEQVWVKSAAPTKWTSKPLHQVNVGDVIVTMDLSSLEASESRVFYKSCRDPTDRIDLIEVKTERGTTVQLTPTHLLLVDNRRGDGYSLQQASAILPGAALLWVSPNGDPEPVVVVETKQTRGSVCDIKTDSWSIVASGFAASVSGTHHTASYLLWTPLRVAASFQPDLATRFLAPLATPVASLVESVVLGLMMHQTSAK